MNTISNTGIQGLLGNINSIITQLKNANTNNNKLFKEYIKSIELKLTEIQKNPTQMKNFLENLKLFLITLKKNYDQFLLENQTFINEETVIKQQEIVELISYLEKFFVKSETEINTIISLLQGVNNGQSIDKKKFQAYLTLFSYVCEPKQLEENIKYQLKIFDCNVNFKLDLTMFEPIKTILPPEPAKTMPGAKIPLEPAKTMPVFIETAPVYGHKKISHYMSIWQHLAIGQPTGAKFPTQGDIVASMAFLLKNLSYILGDFFTLEVVSASNYISIYTLCQQMINEILNCIDNIMLAYILIYANSKYSEHPQKKVWMYVEVIRILRANYTDDLINKIINLEVLTRQLKNILSKYDHLFRSAFPQELHGNVANFLTEIDDCFIDIFREGSEANTAKSTSRNVFFCIKISNIIDNIINSAEYDSKPVISTFNPISLLQLHSASKLAFQWPKNYSECIHYTADKIGNMIGSHAQAIKKKITNTKEKQIMILFPYFISTTIKVYEIAYAGLYGFCISNSTDRK